MLKIVQGFCSAILYLWVVAVNADPQTKLEISLTTLKSDLNLILEDLNSPRTVNIEYAPSAVVRVLVLPKIDAGGGKSIKIEGKVTLKPKSAPVVERSDFVYEDGSFGFPLDQEDTTYIIIKPNPDMTNKQADKSLNYVPLSELKNRLNTEMKNVGWSQVATKIFWLTFQVGSSNTPLTFNPTSNRAHFQQPLKGIALYRGDKLNVRNLVKPRLYKSIKDKLQPTSPKGGLLGGFSQLLATKQPDALMKSFSQIVATKHPDVFFDVWYEPKNGRFGSSSGSLDDIDAVRIYDEWVQDIALAAERAVDTSVSAGRGEHIRKTTFEQDMYNAYTKLFNPGKVYLNAIINYADEIVLDVRTDIRDDRSVSAAGTTQADALGHGPYNVRAYYDLNKLEYSGTIGGEEWFDPFTHDQRSWFLKYLDWSMFERHLRAIWTAMQGGCNQRGKLFYDYRIFYGDSIHVRYDCKTSSIVLQDTISVLTHLPSFHKGSTTKCTSLRYLPTLQVEMQCISTDASPIAIRQEPQLLWMNYVEPTSISFAVLKHDLVMLQETLLRNGKYKKNALTRGTIILDEHMLLVMKLPQGKNHPVEVYPHGSNTDYKVLNFYGSQFSTTNGVVVQLNEVSTALKFQIMDPIGDEYVIGAKYVTINKLKQDLKSVSEKAWSRCTSRKVKNFSFMLVYHRRFVIQGFYDCSENVFLVEGNFRTFEKTKYGGTEITTKGRWINGFIYVQKDKFFITEGQAFNDVYAISVPEINLEVTKKSYGSPINLDHHIFILFKSREG